MSPTASARFKLTDDIQYLRGVGPAKAALLRRIGIATVGDLLEHFPARHVRYETCTIEDLDEGSTATVVGRIAAVRSTFGRGGRKTVSATLIDNTGRCSLAWFNAGWMKDRLQRDMVIRATGQVRAYRDLPQFVNPSFDVVRDDHVPVESFGDVEIKSVYPATESLSSRTLERLISTHLDAMLDQVEEWYGDDHRKKRDLPMRRWAIETLHRPTQAGDETGARRRIAYDELLLMQLAMSIVRAHRRSGQSALPLPSSEEIDRRIRRRFPFSLTKAQDRAVVAIASDLARPRPMNRLVQGDVGCGKTVVALYAALVAIATRTQVAIMAPTELLAEQHARSIATYLRGSRVRHALLVGGMKAAERKDCLASIEGGELDLVVGTHALIQQDVNFRRLGLVVVDEQHRFGVRQRALIRGKGPAPHYLVMTATPIPRTLAMTVFGDLDVTTIDSLPPGRGPVRTSVCTPIQQAEAWHVVGERLEKGEQAYVVYPVIDESDQTELRAATTEFHRLQDTLFPGRRVALLHGRMKRADRETIMADFVAGRIDVLVSTTVIEVGIDVPNATCMVIENAERFGLSQLHQLRGRIGRGNRAGTCFLMTRSRNNERLHVLASTNDGFKIAEEDLRIRGPGEVLGTRQHGLPDLKVADLVQDADLLRLAQQDADEIVRGDAHLREPQHRRLREELSRRYHDSARLLDVG